MACPGGHYIQPTVTAVANLADGLRLGYAAGGGSAYQTTDMAGADGICAALRRIDTGHDERTTDRWLPNPDQGDTHTILAMGGGDSFLQMLIHQLVAHQQRA